MTPRRTKTRHAGVYVSSSGAYEISYIDSVGTRVFKTLPKGLSLRDAQQERARMVSRIGGGEQVVHTRLTISELCDIFLDTQMSGMKKNSQDDYRRRIENHIRPRLGHVKLNNLTTDHVARLVADMKKDGKSAWTIHSVLSPLSRMLQLAVRRGYLSTNHVRNLDKSERPSGFGRKMRILSTVEIGALLRASDEPYRLMFATLIFSGLRIGELLRLTWDDIDFDLGLLHVGDSKTQAGVRDVAIPDFLVQQLAEASLGKETDERAFPVTSSAVRHALVRNLERAKVPHCRVHDLRHTFASILISQGNDIVYVSNQIGHTNGSTTLQIYAHLFEAKKKREEAQRKMQDEFVGVAG